MTPPPAIRLRQVAAGYPGRPVLRGVDLELQPGEMAGVLGPNGAGKTTLFRVLAGLLPCAAGQTEIFGRSQAELPARDRARLVGVVPQSLESPMPFTVEEMVLMGRTAVLERWQAPGSADYAVAERVMAETDVLRLRDRVFSALSGGEKQRTLMAMALAQEPRLLLLDEATAHLDLRHRLDILDLVTRLNRETGVTVLMISHDWTLTAACCPRLLLLDDGRLTADGPPETVMGGGEIARAFQCELRMLRDDTGTLHVIPVRKTAVSATAAVPEKTPASGGRVHVYTGSGKGKTTAAAGLALRALGAGFRVYFGQWLKARPSAELEMLARVGGSRLVLERFGTGKWVGKNPPPEESAEAMRGLAAAQAALASGRFDLVVLDEACPAAFFGLVPASALTDLIRTRPPQTELVFTGRGAPPDLLELADLVTEMREVKHYFTTGLDARSGIEF